MRYVSVIYLSAVCLLISACSAVPVCKEYSLQGETTVLLRASSGKVSQLRTVAKGAPFKVCGVPEGGAEGYHPGNSSWRETSADDWGMGFESLRYGDTLVISTVNEIQYIHDLYYFDELKISLPQGIMLQLVNRELDGDGEADLSEPETSGGAQEQAHD